MIQARKVRVPKEKQKKEFSLPRQKTRRNLNLDVRAVYEKGSFHFYGILLACIILAVASVAQYCKIVTTNFEIGQTENRIEALLEEQRELKMDIANLNSLVRIENIARNELAMEEAGDPRIMTASGDTN